MDFSSGTQKEQFQLSAKPDIDNSQLGEKTYLGGYRNKRTGTVYHFSETQTDVTSIGLPDTTTTWPLRDSSSKAANEKSGKQETQPQDFLQLRAEVAAWQSQEAARIQAAGLDPEQRKFALLRLLEKETQLLAALDRLRCRVDLDKREKALAKRLGQKADPKEWVSCAGKHMTMYQPETLRALEILSCYHKLAAEPASLEERKAVAEHVKQLIPSQGWKAACLVGLLERELDLMTRGVRKETLAGLRKRISFAFVDAVEEGS